MISIIISTYKRKETLKRAVQSVIAQTITDWECFVVHDGPTPDGYYDDMPQDKRVQYLHTPENHGKDTRPKNYGIMQSQGEYIAYLDDDNEWYPEFLEKQLDTIKKTGVDVVYCDMLVFDDAKPNAAPQPAISMPFDPQVLMRKNFIDTSMVMHKRQAVFDVGGWDESLSRFVDWNLWVRMTKWGHTFFQNKTILTKYYISKENSTKHQVRMWRDPVLGVMFEPTFDTSGCLIWLNHLGPNEKESNPKVAIYTLSYDRREYTQRMWHSLKSSTKYPFDWFVWDNGSQDGSVALLKDLKGKEDNFKFLHSSPDNKGITIASNGLVDQIMSRNQYQIVIKADNDCEFMTKWWLESIVDLWKRNHKLYMSPYPEGLLHNPGGAARVGHAFIGAYFVEVSLHVGGLVAAIDARAYKDFRWTDHFLHGNQDAEASAAFREMEYMPMYLPMHRVKHMDGTAEQQVKYKKYFERRKKEKTQTYV